MDNLRNNDTMTLNYASRLIVGITDTRGQPVSVVTAYAGNKLTHFVRVIALDGSEHLLELDADNAKLLADTLLDS